MNNRIFIFKATILITFLTLVTSCAQVTITPERNDGIYDVGETASWTLDFDQPSHIKAITFSIKQGGLQTVKDGDLHPESEPVTINHHFTKPGAVLLDVSWKDALGKENKITDGAIASPEKIKLSAEKPTDFDAFWDAQIEALNQIPKNAELKREKIGTKKVEYYKVQMDNINGSKIQGQLSRPSSGKKLPALLIVQWAGVYPLQKSWVLDKAKEGWLVLNINAHDIPIDEKDSFYKQQANGPLQNYPAIGNEDKNTSYFLRMYLSCYRAAQYLTERADWNGETLVVMGTSQGGMQSLVTAGLHPKISASLALVPAGFDMFGPEIGREPGWPKWYRNIENKDPQKVRETSKYFDVANFIPRITSPVLVGVGLLDQVCPPEGIYAGLNQLSSPKEIVLLPNSAHQDSHGSQDAYVKRVEEHWLPSLLKGENPIRK